MTAVAMSEPIALSASRFAGVRGGRSLDERALVRAAQEGSPEALERLFRRHWRPAHRVAYLIVHDATAAEDIAQEAFLAAMR